MADLGAFEFCIDEDGSRLVSDKVTLAYGHADNWLTAALDYLDSVEGRYRFYKEHQHKNPSSMEHFHCIAVFRTVLYLWLALCAAVILAALGWLVKVMRS